MNQRETYTKEERAKMNIIIGTIEKEEDRLIKLRGKAEKNKNGQQQTLYNKYFSQGRKKKAHDPEFE